MAEKIDHSCFELMVLQLGVSGMGGSRLDASRLGVSLLGESGLDVSKLVLLAFELTGHCAVVGGNSSLVLSKLV